MKGRPFLIVFVLLPALLLFAGAAEAVTKSTTGCGLGYYIFKDATDTFATQLLAVTTNSMGTQTTGILTGTGGCRQPKRLVSDERLHEFVASNMDSLAADMASGQGESLDTMAELMSVPEPDRPVFYATLQSNFRSIFTSRDVRPAQVIDNILKVAG